MIGRFSFGIGLVICLALQGVRAGAVEPNDQKPSPTEMKLREPTITADDRSHWSFRPLRRPAIPHVAGATAARIRNPIDCFISEKLSEQGLALQPAARRHVLTRRISFDLLGLPPTQEAAKTAGDRAWNQWLAACFASPAYGERWAQHWLDLARFAETDGFEHDKVRDQAWRYRDWVVSAWNRHATFDKFVAAQLAGDQSGAAVATMFCTSGPDMPDINSQDERKHALLNEMTGTVGAVFLALQVGCAQCHDHKYDPLSQADFYRLRAYFEPSVLLQKNKSVGPLQQQPPKAPARLWIRGDWRRPGPVLSAGVPRVVNGDGHSVNSRRELAAWLTSNNHPLTARVIVNRLWQHHFGVGLVTTPSDFGVMGDWPSHPELLDFLASELIDRGWNLQAIQRMIIDSATYRQRSRLPLSASADEVATWKAARKKDPNNRLLSRYRRKRLDGESVRDALFAVSGSLNRTMGGPGIRPPLPPEMKQTLLRNQWNVSPNPADHYRRSIYVFARRNLLYPIFQVLDRPEANASCPRRSRSTTAPQALLLLNSPVTAEAAERLAKTIADQCADEQCRVREAFHLTLHRLPTATELKNARQFLQEQRSLAARENRELSFGGLKVLCLALFNSSEFLYLD